MKSVVSLALVALMSSSVKGLQMILSTKEPQCLQITPKRIGANIDVNYSVSGVNEDMVLFTITQGDKTIETIDSKSSGEVSFRNTRMVEINVCWQKLDRKSKKVNFLISQANQHLEEKADASTIEAVSEQIEALQFKLDEISMNIVSQVETEKVHFELTQETASSQTWMNVIKMLLVLLVCGGQVYMTTSFFNKGNSGGRRVPNDINPFASASI